MTLHPEFLPRKTVKVSTGKSLSTKEKKEFSDVKISTRDLRSIQDKPRQGKGLSVNGEPFVLPGISPDVPGKARSTPGMDGKGHNPIMPPHSNMPESFNAPNFGLVESSCRNHLARSILSWPIMLMPGYGRARGGHEAMLSSVEGVEFFS